MKTCDEMVNDLKKRRELYLEEQKRKRKMIVRLSSSIGCCALAVVIGIGIMHGGARSVDPPVPGGSDTPKEDVRDDAEGTGHGTNAAVGTDMPSGDVQDGGTGTDIDGEYGGFMIPALPESNKINFVGEELTDAEAKAYFDANLGSIESSLLSSEVDTEDLKISDSGYCYVSFDGREGVGLYVQQNFRNYPVYSREKLVAIVTLTKENGVIGNTVTFGAAWLEDFGAYLRQHKGEELLFVFANMEIVIAPDGSIMNPMGYDVSGYLSGVESPYEWFYDTHAVYVP